MKQREVVRYVFIVLWRPRRFRWLQNQEWELMKAYERIIKYGDKEESKRFIEEHEEKK